MTMRSPYSLWLAGGCLIAALLGTLLVAVPVATDEPGGSASPYPKARRLAILQDQAIAESSGVMVAQGQSGSGDQLFWTHNDSGDGPFLYLFDRRGASRGTWLVAGATSVDAEDCAAGPGPVKGKRYLYYGDTGDNGSNRADCVVWRVPEPVVSTRDPAADRERARLTAPAEGLRFVYPDGPHDCEALLIHPVTGAIYLVTKERTKPKSSVFKFRSTQVGGPRQILVKVGEISLGAVFPPNTSLVTAGDIAPDGRRLVIRDYFQLYEFTLPNNAASFDAIWQQTPRAFPSPPLAQGEGVCYSSDGQRLYLTSEQLPTPLYEMSR